VGRSSEQRRVAVVVGVYKEGVNPAATGLHGGGALDLEVETIRKKNLRTGSTTGASTVVNTGVLV
jgi:hypothetical protein